MTNAITNNSLIAALFGGGAAQPLRFANGTSTNTVLPSGSSGDRAQPVDTVEISQAGKRAAATDGAQGTQGSQSTDAPTGLGGKTQLTDEEQKQVSKLKQRDAEVRRHESAHKAAAGSNASGGPTFEFTTGPDGKRYAVGGEVQIDAAAVKGDPQATIQKMQQIRRAALAPASPSGQDRAVAAQAAATERSARAELAEERRASASGASDQQPGQTAINGTTQTPQGIERIGEILDLLG